MTHLRALLLAALAAGSLTGAVAPQQTVTSQPNPLLAGLPEQLRPQYERELAPLPKAGFEIPSKAGPLRGEVEANGKVVVGREDPLDTLTVPLGTQQGLICHLDSGRIDAAGAVTDFLERIRKKARVMAVVPVEVAAVAGCPAFFVEIVYLHETAERKAFGHVKQAVVVHPERSLVCYHDEPGYAATFRRIVKGLIGALKYSAPDERESARYSQIQTIQVQGVPVGFVEHLISPSPDGGTKLWTFSSLLMPRAPGEAAAIDEVRRSVLDGSGQIASVVHVQISGGKVETQLSAEREEDGKSYTYQGTVKGKEIQGRFSSREGLPGDSLVARRTLRLLSGESREERFQEYAPSINPTSALEVIYRKGAGERRLTIDLGGMVVQATVGADGWPMRLEMSLGGATMVYDQIWARGMP